MTKKEKQAEEDRIICEVVNRNFERCLFKFKEYKDEDVKVKFFRYQEFENFGLQLYVEGEPYATITVNIEPMQYREFCVDINNFPEGMGFLYDNRIAEPTGACVRSGFVIYPVWKLNNYFFIDVKEALEKSEANIAGEKYRNACGSCKYFEEAEIRNKTWRKCKSVYKKGVHAGENRLCYQSLNKCCDYVRKEEGDNNV